VPFDLVHKDFQKAKEPLARHAILGSRGVKMKRVVLSVFLLGACGQDANPCGMGKARTDGGDCIQLPPPEESETGEDSGGSDSSSETGADSGETGADSGETDPEPEPEVVLDVYLLGGQSNTDGGGLITGLPPRLQIAQEDVQLFWSGWAEWRGLAPASYWGPAYFGPEVTMGRLLADEDPTQTVAVIKHAIGGTDLAQCWYPGAVTDDGTAGPCYAGFKATVDAALAELDEQGVLWRIAGMGWMQGESDASNVDWANAYADNLTAFVARVREDVGTPAMPFAMGRIDCSVHCAYRDTVRDAQDAVAAALAGVSIVETQDLPQITDSLHFDASGMRTLGERLAGALQGLTEEAETARPATYFSGSFSSNYTGNFIVGYAFDISSELVVTDLGTLDYGWDGMSDSADVAIWDEASGNLLVKATVPAAKSAQSSIWDGWRYVAIEPFTLQAGRYVIGSQVYNGSADRYVHNATVGFRGGVTWVEGRYANGTSVRLPTIVTTEATSWFGPNFLFRMPENTPPPP
jgi:hypothetical protein